MTACRVFIALCVSLAALSSFGCEDGNTTRIGPSRINSRAPSFVSSSVNVQSVDISALSVPGSVCPVTSPFFAPFNLVIQAGGAAELHLQQVQMQFVDILGSAESFTELGSPQLATMFGTTVIPPFATRTFPFALPFGCAAGRVGVVNIVAVTDADGHAGTISLRVNVR